MKFRNRWIELCLSLRILSIWNWCVFISEDLLWLKLARNRFFYWRCVRRLVLIVHDCSTWTIETIRTFINSWFLNDLRLYISLIWVVFFFLKMNLNLFSLVLHTFHGFFSLCTSLQIEGFWWCFTMEMLSGYSIGIRLRTNPLPQMRERSLLFISFSRWHWWLFGFRLWVSSLIIICVNKWIIGCLTGLRYGVEPIFLTVFPLFLCHKRIIFGWVFPH